DAEHRRDPRETCPRGFRPTARGARLSEAGEGKARRRQTGPGEDLFPNGPASCQRRGQRTSDRWATEYRRSESTVGGFQIPNFRFEISAQHLLPFFIFHSAFSTWRHRQAKSACAEVRVTFRWQINSQFTPLDKPAVAHGGQVQSAECKVQNGCTAIRLIA